MKRSLVLIALVVLASTCMGLLLIWKTVIQPKNTRLALYEVITASKYNRSNPQTAEQITSWLDELRGLEITHLKHCEQIQYYNKNASLKRGLKSLDVDSNRALPLTSLQKAAQRYFLEPPSLEMLSQIGKTEFETVISEIRLFETELIANGYTGTLNELATHPKNFTADPKEVARVYNRFILKGEQALKSRFYNYDIPKGKVNISAQGHRWSAYAQYNKNNNSMTAFFDAEEYDISIAAFISIHEMFPGHHLSAKAGLSKPLCAGDNATSFSWLGEGWATYAEFVADEEGFFQKPEHKLAWLDYRLTRAMRIILDVKRMQGLKEHAALKLIWDQHVPERLVGSFDKEFNRLNKSRHQHLSYLFGYKAILETKVKLVEELGPSFDEKKFHDAILRLGHKEPHVFYETVKIAMEIPTNIQSTMDAHNKN